MSALLAGGPMEVPGSGAQCRHRPLPIRWMDPQRLSSRLCISRRGALRHSRTYLCGRCAGAVEDAGGGADVHVQGGADVGVAGDGGDVGWVEFPGEQGGGAQEMTQAVPGPAPVAVLVAP